MVLFHGLAPCDGFESIIREIIENVYGQTEVKGISYDSLLDRQLARVSELKENRNLTAEELQELAYDETIAEMSETILSDTDAAQRVSQELYKKDRTLWEKIRDFFMGLVEKLRSAYKGLDPDSDMGRVMKRAIQDNEAVAQAWAEAVVEAGENYQLQDGKKITPGRARGIRIVRVSILMNILLKKRICRSLPLTKRKAEIENQSYKQRCAMRKKLAGQTKTEMRLFM